LRRIPADSEWFNPLLSEPVQRVAFAPHKERDRNGISVFRETFVTAAELAGNGQKGPNGYYVVRLMAQDVFALGLSVVPDSQDGQLPGHALIPELTPQLAKQRSKELQHKLARLGGKNVAHAPEP
jgi:hypothetical protein